MHVWRQQRRQSGAPRRAICASRREKDWRNVHGDEMKIITLACGAECIVDDDDFEMLSKYRWSKHSKERGYAVTRTTKHGKTIYMHRLITGADDGKYVDHANHNTLDNRKENLSVGSQSDNLLNRAKMKTGAGRFRGVHPHRPGSWIVMYRGKYLGVFRGDDAEERGARAYDAAAIAHRGQLAQTNFPQENAA